MKNATHNRIRRLLPLLILVGLASHAPTVSAGVGVWTSNGPYGGDIMALAIDPVNPATLYADASGGGLFKRTDGGMSWTFGSDYLDSAPSDKRFAFHPSTELASHCPGWLASWNVEASVTVPQQPVKEVKMTTTFPP